ncbi:class I SAM-dependent methyltransferase [Actinophytocola sp.]|uniref:class I SAM-dependent methyltransferase n=1 Tax=Actinophytocola sp. TaxID=1872138 RepID=UPI003D6A6BB1
MTTFSLAAEPAPARLDSLLGSLRGTVLELGPGVGHSLRHYAPDVRWIGVEPDPGHRERVRFEAARLGRRAHVVAGRAERLDLAGLEVAASVDAVVATFVLCSVADQAAALAEVFRVLRPGGRYVFAEHVAAPAGTWARRAQHVRAALAGVTGRRCRPNRDSLPAIERAGFDVVELRTHTRAGPFGTGTPQVAGVALRPAPTRGTPS